MAATVKHLCVLFVLAGAGVAPVACPQTIANPAADPATAQTSTTVNDSSAGASSGVELKIDLKVVVLDLEDGNWALAPMDALHKVSGKVIYTAADGVAREFAVDRVAVLSDSEKPRLRLFQAKAGSDQGSVVIELLSHPRTWKNGADVKVISLSPPEGASQADAPPAVDHANSYEIHEAPLGPAPPASIKTADWVTSNDGMHLAYQTLSLRDRQASVVVDGKPGPSYSGVQLCPRIRALRFSADGQHLAYVVGQDHKEFVAVDGQSGPEYDQIGRHIVLSSDGKHTVYEAKKGEHWLVVADGQPGPEYEIVGGLVLSDDGRHFVYGASHSNQWFAVVDGQPGPQFDDLGWITISSDGSRAAYSAKKNDHWMVVADGQPGLEYDAITSLTLSPDGKCLVYAAQRGATWCVVVDGQPGPEYDEVSRLAFSSDSRRLAYCARNADQCCVVVDNQAEPAYDGYPIPVMGLPNGQRVIYAAVQDDQPGPCFSPDSQHLAYIATRGRHQILAAPFGQQEMTEIPDKQVVIVDGRAGPKFDAIGSRLIFSPDGNRIAYAASQGDKELVVVDDQAGPPFDKIMESGPVFSPDSRHVAYAAQRGNKWLVVVDGQAGTEYDNVVIHGPSFDDQGAVTYLALKNASLLRVRHVPAAMP